MKGKTLNQNTADDVTYNDVDNIGYSWIRPVERFTVIEFSYSNECDSLDGDGNCQSNHRCNYSKKNRVEWLKKENEENREWN